MGDATFTFRVEEELKAAFGEAAKSQDQTGAQLLRGFMREYVRNLQDKSNHDDWFRQKVRIGQQSADAGNLISDDEVEAEFAAKRQATRRKLGSKTP